MEPVETRTPSVELFMDTEQSAKESAVLLRVAWALGDNGAASCGSAYLNRNPSRNVGNGAGSVWNGANVARADVASSLPRAVVLRGARHAATQVHMIALRHI